MTPEEEDRIHRVLVWAGVVVFIAVLVILATAANHP